MIKSSIIVISAGTLRSFNYIFELQKAGITIEEVCLLDSELPLPGKREIDNSGAMYLKIVELCKINNITLSSHESDVNSKSLFQKLKKLHSELIVYSGFGGQIIKTPLLSLEKLFLHIHPGSLPKYRGSTTIYYSILNQDECGVTAILLDKNIDTGMIVGKKNFTLSNNMSDIDFDIDICFRTELLIDVVTHYINKGCFEINLPQDLHKGMNYYIAHPVLRHIAKMRKV